MTTQAPQDLNHHSFQAAVKEVRDRFAMLKAKHPTLKGYHVLSIPGKQTGIGSSPQEILASLPSIVVEDAAKSALRDFLKTPPSKEASETEKKRWNEQLQELATRLRYHGDCRVEIRFDQLDYALIARLQSDELVDRELTPQTAASIRIVLGTLSAFAP